jgi:hypothetical protein
MNTLYTFGCSFTEDYKKSNSYNEYKKFRNNELPDVWPTLLSKNLQKNLINKGHGGIGNSQIFVDFCELSERISKDDIVIIGWTKITRFRWADENRWQHLMGSDKDMNSISLKTHNEILVNRTNPLYIEEINNYEKIIIELSKYKQFQVYFWSSDSDIIYKSPKNKETYLLYEYKNEFHEFTPFHMININGGPTTIEHETNGIVHDNHLGERGHKIQSDLFYQHIKKYSL